MKEFKNWVRNNPTEEKTNCFFCRNDEDHEFDPIKHHICKRCIYKLYSVAGQHIAFDVGTKQKSETVILGRFATKFMGEFCKWIKSKRKVEKQG